MPSRVVLILLLSSVTAHSQEKSTRYLNARVHQGFIIQHSKDLDAVRNSYPIGLEIDLGWHKTSQRVWADCNCYPKTGLTIGIWDFDNREVLGYGLTSMFYLQPVFGAQNRFSFSVRGGIGISYQTNPYDPDENPSNLSYSTYFAFPLQLGIGGHFSITDTWQIEASIIYNHISNGGLEKPNKGINWPTAALGITRYLNTPVFPEREKIDWRKEENSFTRTDITFFGTYQEPEDGYYLLSGGLEIKHARRVGRLSNLSAGGEWMYDTYRSKLTENGNDDGNMIGVAVGHEFILGNFLFSQQFGVYLLKPQSRPEDVYQRYGLIYRINDNLSAGFNLKAHAHVADFADLRIGYSF